MENKPDALRLARDIDKLLQKKALSFEEALEALEQVADMLDGGQAKLEDSLELFERGVMLTQRCQKILQQADLKVRKLTENSRGGIAVTPLAETGGDNEDAGVDEGDGD